MVFILCNCVLGNTSSSKDCLNERPTDLRIGKNKKINLVTRREESLSKLVEQSVTSLEADIGMELGPSSDSLKLLLSLIISSAALGNTLVCFVVLFTKKLRKSLSSYLILSLALSDLLASCLVMTFDLDTLVRGKWIHSQTMCTVWTTAYTFIIPSSIWNMLAMTVDRYKSLSDPLNRYRAKPFMTRRRLVAVIAVIWIYSLVFSLIPQMGWKPTISYNFERICPFNITPSYSLLSSAINFLLPMVITSVFHVKIYQIARRFNVATAQRSQAVDNVEVKGKNTCERTQVQKTFKKNTKYAKMVCLLVCAFLICWMPYTLLSITGIIFVSWSDIPPELSYFLLFLGYLNSALNPFLYSFNNRSFRRGFKSTFTTIFKYCHCQRCEVLKPCLHLPHSGTANYFKSTGQPINISLVSFVSTNTII